MVNMHIARNIRKIKLDMPMITYTELGKLFNISASAVFCIVTNKTWKG